MDDRYLFWDKVTMIVVFTAVMVGVLFFALFAFVTLLGCING